ncbi:prenyltransferase beta subunit [Actinokineospora baliensis]|uniref:prenyltransferase/squalene oxidase repeat-containing protein n=1 Tax=Actinokineospora baliensis TaxID=547056 RepID=UPI00195886BF|nr:prenyltransferase/squalene oxidase repeat-containing protein [Actinokineospora baliensis]MBM7774771.1 prenyltransferase beta subunit [Actinokineospora baliensis]
MTGTRTDDGGARQPDADLWCSYAAVRALRWMGTAPADPDSVAGFLLARRNDDGGFGWQRGLPSDVWATYYSAQGLADLGRECPEPDRLAKWLASTRTPDGGFGMTPGQSADVWATYYACRLTHEVLGTPVERGDDLADWLAALQTGGGGLSWAPGGTATDVRACYYGALAWESADTGPPPWDRDRLVGWLHDQQRPDGGFGFAPGEEPCTWAAFRATGALRALGARPLDTPGLVDWLSARELPGGGFERWPGYGQADVWSAFTVVGALAHLGSEPSADAAGRVSTVVRSYQLPGSGFTYRAPATAGDSLATAAFVLEPGKARPDELAAARDWLLRAQTPYEGGVMYMPGRGAEVRCTLWAASALRRTGSVLDGDRLGRWLRGLQNTDGGVGYWVGRGSNLTSTASAVESAVVSGLDPAAVLDTARVADFVHRCLSGASAADVPGGPLSLTATAHAARTLDAIGAGPQARAVANTIVAHASPLGGWSAIPRHLPDLASTYQAVLTAQVLDLPWDRASARRLLDRLRTGDGYAWSPLGHRGGGPLADCLGGLLALASTDGGTARLPRLNL